MVQFTTTGIHKDDLLLLIEDNPAKKFASQGQQKSIVVALKLAQFEFLRKNKNAKPIVMMDDLFDKLDDKRVEQIIKMIKDHEFGQLFITDTHPDRIKKILDEHGVGIKAFNVTSGNVEYPEYSE